MCSINVIIDEQTEVTTLWRYTNLFIIIIVSLTQIDSKLISVKAHVCHLLLWCCDQCWLKVAWNFVRYGF